MLDVTIFCFFASYLLALLIEATRAITGRSWLRWPSFFAALAGLVAHTFFLWNRGQALDLPPLLASQQDWMFVVAWIVCVLYVFVIAYDQRVGIGLFALPVVLVFVFVGRFASDVTSDGVAAGAIPRGWLLLHAILLSLGIAAVIAGVVLSLMYLLQHNRLKHKRTIPRGLTLLNLETLAQWNYMAILIAVPMLGLGLLAGVVLVFLGRQNGTSLTLNDPFVIVSSLAWLVMVLVLGRTLRNRQPVAKAVAGRTLLAFSLLLITLLGLQLITGGGHTSTRPTPVSSAGISSTALSIGGMPRPIFVPPDSPLSV